MNLSHYATFDLQGRLRVQIVTYEDVSVCNVSQNYLNHHVSTHTVSTTRRVHVRVRAVKRLMSAHFLNLKNMYMRNF